MTAAARSPGAAAPPSRRRRCGWWPPPRFGVEMAVSARYGYVRDELYFLASGPPPRARRRGPAGADAAARPARRARHREHPRSGCARCPRSRSPRWCCHRGDGAGPRGGPPRPAHRRRSRPPAAPSTWAPCTSSPRPCRTSLCWTVTLLLVTRLLTSGDPRWWLAIGGAAGIGMTAKWNIGFLRRRAAPRVRVHPGRPAAAAQPLPGLRRRCFARARRARLRLAGGARLAELRRLPRAAARRLAEPRARTGRAGPLHEHRARAAVGARRRLGAAVGASAGPSGSRR